ncbi:MAG: ATP-binding cassette domain-containing protein [Lachnospiraceae bacterium]
MHTSVRSEHKNWIKRAAILLFWLGLWQLVALLLNNTLLFAGPAETAVALIREASSILFWETVGVSVLRILAGFLAALFTGCLLGAVSFRWDFFRELLSPVMLFAKAVPVASFAVILLIWWGAGWLSTAICFLVVLPIVYVNFLEGLQHADRKLLEMADVFGMPLKNRFFAIYRPALAPFMEGCLKTAMGMGIKAGVAAEVIGIPKWSIGGELYLSKIYLDTAGVFAWTVVVISLSFCMEKAVLLLWKAFCAWKPAPCADKKGHTGRHEEHKNKNKNTGLVLEGINKAFGSNTVLVKVRKRLEPDKVYCVMAPSGAGKTTLLHIMAGIIKPDGGSIYAFETDGSRTCQLRVGMVFQEDRLCEEETAIHNIELVCGDRKMAKLYLEELLPEAALQEPVKNLSGGMRRRVCIARAFAADADVVLLDEPFNGLDTENRDNAAAFIRKHRDGRMVVVATHEEEDAVRLHGEIWHF